jgi:hypothetical protein
MSIITISIIEKEREFIFVAGIMYRSHQEEGQTWNIQGTAGVSFVIAGMGG